MLFKICIWMNIPSHYQSAFFRALDERDDVDLQVRYLQGVSLDRAGEGWNETFSCEPFEKIVEATKNSPELVSSVPDGRDRIHLISSYFHSGLVEYFCKQGLRWCHWSEMPGIRLAELLGYRMALYRLANPIMLAMKGKEGKRIMRHALGAFGQGIMARRSFQRMGVVPEKMADLFYTPEALPEAGASRKILDFAAGKKVFLSVGALCPRKGVDVLLHAFAQLDTQEWCVVFCGLDKAGGVYQALAKKLGIKDQVLFLGAYPSKQIAEVYRSANVFVLPSRFDGWGAVLNEAASTGLPLIGTDLCGGSWHVIKEGVNGVLVKAGSAESLKKGLQNFVEHPEKIEAQGRASRERFDTEFTPARNAERLVATLNQWGAHAG